MEKWKMFIDKQVQQRGKNNEGNIDKLNFQFD